MLALAAVITLAAAQCVVYPSSLTTEYTIDPIGIDNLAPRLSWKLEYSSLQNKPLFARSHSASFTHTAQKSVPNRLPDTVRIDRGLARL